ncbi:MAG: glycosyltransferase family 4 protein [Deltaproteobacteria bacterium]
MPRTRIRTILHGIAVDYYRPAGKKPASGKLRCLAGGVWLRDYRALFETARLLRDRPEIEFHIIASDLEKPSDLDSVFIHSRVSDEEYLQLFRESDVLFMPLETATANNVILEGLACGLPVVSTELISVRAYVPGPEGLLIKDNDPGAFAGALLKLQQNPGKLRELGARARGRAEQLSWERVGREYTDFYLKIRGRREKG